MHRMRHKNDKIEKKSFEYVQRMFFFHIDMKINNLFKYFNQNR